MQPHRLIQCGLILCGPILALAVWSAAGCRPKQKLESTAASAAATTLKVVVIDEPELAKAISLLKAEWHAQHGSQFEVSQLESARIEELPQLAPDAILFPAARLGELVEADRIVSLPKSALADRDLNWADLLPIVQGGVASYGGRVYAVPFGSPVLTLCYRSDLFQKFDRKVPTTWAQYAAEVKFFQDRAGLGNLAPPDDAPWHASLEPLAPGWAGKTLLARAAAYARHRDNFSSLFNIDDFTPLIDQPPFVKALDELVSAAKSCGSADDPLDPAGVRAALLAGQCALALTWPTAAHSQDSKSPASHAGQVAFGQLPGGSQSYNFATRIWDQRTPDEPVHVPLVPIAGSLGAVAQAAPNAEAAIQLLSWLAGPKWGSEIGASCPTATLDRRSQLDAGQKWVEPGVTPAAARQYATVTSEALSQPVWLHALRIPGGQEYEAALDAAVQRALSGDPSPKQALAEAATAWREISQRLGVQRQLAAYRRSLGLD